jgi:hypothetical protein
MSEPIPKSVNQTVYNLLVLLAQKGDEKAIAALKNFHDNEVEIVEDEEESDLRVVVSQSQGDYLVTQHGVSYAPNTEQQDS